MKPRAALRLARAEGARSLADRALERLAEARRRHSFRAGPLPQVPVLNVLDAPPAARLGGVQAQFLERMRCEARRRPVAVMYAERGSHRLEVESARARVGATLPGDVDGALRQAVERLGCRLVHVENLAGFAPQDLLRALHGLPARIVIGAHDFAAFCSRHQLLERGLSFCGYCRDLERCGRCLDRSPDVQARHRAQAAELLRRADALVFPSAFLRDTLADLLGPLDPGRLHVVPPGLDLRPLAAAAPPIPDRVAFAGAVRRDKGAFVFAELACAAPELEWHAFGGGDASALLALRAAGVRLHGYYRCGTLPRLLRRGRVALVVAPSIWPETYGLVVDEAWAAGVPAVAFDLGAPGERIRRLGGGRVVPLAEGAPGLLRAVREALRQDRAPSLSAIPTAEASADRMLELVEALIR